MEKSNKKFIFICSLMSFLVLEAIVWLVPLAFTGYKSVHPLSGFWLFISDSGGIIGTPILMIFIGAILTKGKEDFAKKATVFFQFFVLIAIVLGVVGIINEHTTKPYFAVPRPSHKYLEKKGLVPIGFDKFYAMSKSKRREYLQKSVKEHRQKIDYIHPSVINHWALESGFSFPSGHSLNSFAFGVILAYVLYASMASNIKYTCFLALLWSMLVCISRVALGVHTPLDVSVGSSIGIVLSSILIATGALDKLIEQ